MTDETDGRTGDERDERDEAAAQKPKRLDLSNPRELPLPERKAPREINVEVLPYEQRHGVSAHDRLQIEKARRPGPVAKLARTFVGFAIFGLLLLALYAGLSAIDDDKKPQAAWSAPSAPDVKPVNLDDF